VGVYVNRLPTRLLAWACAVTISALNVFLLYKQLG
jgi:Mn2+/Fe2+ NRAMP family transporter